jgi:hypothetical protein
MEKLEIIQSISNIIKDYGSFSISEVEEGERSVVVGSLGSSVGLAEYFREDYCEVNVYEPSSFSSDPMDTYKEEYVNLSKEALSDVLFVCQQWEAENIRTQKRIN